MSANVLTPTDATFDQLLGEHQGLLMVDFWAEWCVPCKRLAPVLNEVLEETKGKAALAKVNVDEHPELAARYNVRSVPTVLFLKDGRILDQIVGFVPKGMLREKIDAFA